MGQAVTTTSSMDDDDDDNVPRLVLMKGHPGSGKSSLALVLARSLGYPLIDKDDARDTLHAAAFGATTTTTCVSKDSTCLGRDEEERQQGDQHIDLNQISYDIMIRYVETQLQVGLSCIVDSPLSRVEIFRRLANLACQYTAKVYVVECTTQDESVWATRVQQRALQDIGSASSHKPRSWQDIQDLLESYPLDKNTGHRSFQWPLSYSDHTTAGASVEFITIDTTVPTNRTPHQLAAEILSRHPDIIIHRTPTGLTDTRVI